MMSSNWDDYPTIGNAKIPYTGEKQEAPKQEVPLSLPPTMESSNWDDYPTIGNAKIPAQPEPKAEQKSESIFAFPSKDSLYNKFFGEAPDPNSEEVQSPIKHGFRNLAQVPAGLAKVLTYPADIVKALGVADALQEFEDLKDRGIQFDEEKYMQGLEDAARMFPTQERAEKWIEENTGIPLEPLTAEQKRTRLASEFLSFITPYKDLKNASFRPPTKPSPPAPPNLAAEIIGPDSGSPFRTGEEALNATRPAPPSSPAPPSGPRITDQTELFGQMNQRTRPASLQGRVTRQEADRIGIQPTPTPGRNATVEERALGVFRHEARNPTTAGNAVRDNLIQQSDAARQRLNGLYDEADSLNSSFAVSRGDVVDSYLTRIAEIDGIASPSTAQKVMRREMRNIVNRYARFNAEGEIIELLPISNQQVLDQAKALRSRVESDFMHGNAGNEFIPMIQDLTGSARAAAVEANAMEAVQALDNANAAFIEWTETFNNDLIAKIRNPSNRTPNKNFNSLKDIDNFNIARPILEQNPQGRALVESLQRDIAQKQLNPLFNRGYVNRTDLDRALRELEPVLTEQQINGIRDSFNHTEPRFPGNARRIERPEQAPAGEPNLSRVQKAQRPEQLNKLMNERSGIQEVRESVPEEVFNRMRQDKTKDILFQGKHEASPTAQEIYDILNKTKNRELMIELHGEQVVNDLSKTAKAIADEEATLLASKEAKELSKKEIKDRWRKRLKATQKALYVAHYLGLV